jgi:hypothetical protein
MNNSNHINSESRRNNFRTSQKESLGESPLDYPELIFYGFGVRPGNPLAWSIFLIVVFGLVFRGGDGFRKLFKEEALISEGNIMKMDTVYQDCPVTLIDPFLFSLGTFTSGATSFLQPHTEYKVSGGSHTRLAILERVLGSIFIGLLIACISRTYLIR